MQCGNRALFKIDGFCHKDHANIASVQTRHCPRSSKRFVSWIVAPKKNFICTNLFKA